jgi:WhiB family redox-sensing transcriptional regulator
MTALMVVTDRNAHILHSLSTGDGTSWRDDAACKGVDLDVFFPVVQKANAARSYDEARVYCASCPVRDECLADMLERREFLGFGGGTTPSDRRRMCGPCVGVCRFCGRSFDSKRPASCCPDTVCQRARHREDSSRYQRRLPVAT